MKKIIIHTPLDTLASVLLIATRFSEVTVKAIEENTVFEVACIGDDKGGLEYFKSWANKFIAASPLIGNIKHEEIVSIVGV